jgi:hypothetical protein
MVDLDARFRMMDEFGEYCQIISLASPPLEAYVAGKFAASGSSRQRWHG